MVTLLDLPDDIYFMITNFLDGLSIIALSESCIKFSQFYSHNIVMRKFSIGPLDRSGHRNISRPFSFITKFLKKNYQLLSYLDLSYFKWHGDRLPILNAIKKLPITKLNIIESNLKEALFKMPDTLMKISDLSYSFAFEEYLSIPLDLKNVTVFYNFRKKIPSYGNHSIFGKIKSVEKLTIVSYSCTLPEDIISFIDTKIPEIVIKILGPCNIFDFYYFRHKIPNNIDSPKLHYALETLTGIFLSNQLYQDLVNFPCLLKITSTSEFDFYSVVNYHFYRTKNDEEYKTIVCKVKSMLHHRSTKSINLYGSEYCMGNGFKFLEYLSQISDIEHLSLEACALETKPNPESSNQLFKKARISKINSSPPNEDLLKSISLLHKNIKSLQIMCDNQCLHGGNVARKRFLSLHYDSLSQFKNLKYLSIEHKLITCSSFYPMLFKNLIFLELLNLESEGLSSQNKMAYLNELPQSVHLAKSLKVLRLYDSLHNINPFLQLFSKSSSLSVIDFHYHSDITGKKFPLLEMKSIRHVLNQCSGISYIHLYDSEMPPSHEKTLKKFERIVMECNKTIFANFTTREYFMNYIVNPFGELV